MEAVDDDDDNPRPLKRGRGENGAFESPASPPLPYDNQEAYNSRVVVSHTHWVFRHVQDVIDVIQWLVETKKVEAHKVTDFLSKDNARDRVDTTFLNRITDEYGKKYALRFSARLEDLGHRHQHDILRLLNSLIRNDSVLLNAVEKKFYQLSYAQSDLRKKLRE